MIGRPTMKDIAGRLGVSPATVSRALSGTGLVAEPTLSRVLETARLLDYRPNVSARSLRTRRAMAVLMVVRDVGNPFYLDILKGVEATARAAGYAVLMGNTQDDPQREDNYFDMLRDGHADGMILMTGKLPVKSVVFNDAQRAPPVVVALETIENSDFPHVQIDNVAAARTAVDHLIGLGHRRVAHIAGPLPEIMARHRLQGYRLAMEAAGLAVPPGFEQRGNYLLHGGRTACRALFETDAPPSAIFAANDEMAYGAIHELRRMGLDVPRDVSVVGFDDLYLSEAFHPPLTTMYQPRTEIGRRAMLLLLDILTGAAVRTAPLVLPTQLRIRASTAPPAP